MAANDKNMAVKKFQKSYFDVLGLCCSSEVPLIENILKPLDGIKDVSVIVPSRTVIVVHDNLLISQIQIVKVLNQARLEANVRVYGEANYKKRWPSPFAIACGLLLVLSLLKYIYNPFRWVALGAVAVGIFPIAWKGLVAIQNFRLDINILAIVAVIGTIVLKDYLEAGTIVFLFTIAEWLESRASHKATAVMSSLMSIAPQKAVIAETGEVVDAEEVKVNTILAVKAGEIIPIDGIVVEGKCEVDEKTLTGESFPVAKQKDSTVWAGTINLNGYIGVKTTVLAEDCVVARMAKLVEEAQNNKSRTQRFIDKCAKYYTPAVIIISVCFAVIPAVLRVHNKDHWFHLALVVLVSACPCALILSTPVATFCALSKAATSGLLIKGGDYLEVLAKIKIMAFDKTGTITRGEFVVTDFRSLYHDIGLNTLLYWVTSIESKSSHPMAAALVHYGRLHSIEPKPENVEEFQIFPGEGIHGKIDGKDIYVGNRKISQRAGCGTVPTLEGDAKEGQTIGYIYHGATPAGIFSLSDACRSGVKEAVKDLKSLGIKTAMLTGDSHAAAMHAQDQLGHALEVVHAELLPEDKARIIRGFKKEGPTAMIGDGMNDAPALATADIGISMGISGSALATETGHVILMSNDIRKLPKAIQLARKTHRKVIENIIISITTKTAILALAFAGHPLVWAAVLADVGTCLLVIFNSMLLLRGTHKHGRSCCKSSTAPHVHKHVCNTGGCHSSHNRHHCSSHNIADQNDKCTDSADRQSDGCVGGDVIHHHHDSTAPHVHKHACNTGGCHSSHNHHHCSSHNIADQNDKCTDSADRPSDGCVGGDVIHHHHHHHHHEAKHGINMHNHGCGGPSISSSCGKEKCTNLVEMRGDCVRGGELPDAKQSKCNHLNHSHTCSQQMTNNGHCHKKHCDKNHVKDHIKDEELGNMVESSCDSQPENREVHCCESKKHGTTIDIARGSGSGHACVSLEKREIGGCCKSFRKECCAKHGHFGANFGGGLSEVIIE